MALSSSGRRSGSSRRGRSLSAPRRKKNWAHFTLDQSVIGDDTRFFDVLSDYKARLDADLVGNTVMRVRGALGLDLPAELGRVIFGIRIFTESTLTTLGPGSGPIADPDADWMARLPFPHAGGQSITDIFEIDVRSTRKLDELGQGLLIALDVSGFTTAVTVNLDLSILLAMP